jgi:transmembrane sensor
MRQALPARALEQASRWVARQGADDYDATAEADFAAWYGAAPENARAYEQICRLWGTLGQVQRQRLKPAKGRRHAVAGAVSLALLLGSLSWLPEWWLAARADHVAALGNNRHIDLADGSRVILESGSALRVRLSQEGREVELLRGRALFEVARQPRGESFAPFSVAVGDTRATALGTRYQVEKLEGETVVTVLESRVAVRCGDCLDGRQETVLGPGDMARVVNGSLETTPAPAGADAWSDGMLAFDRQPFAVAAGQLQRYLPQKVVLLSQAARQERVSGTVDPARPEAALDLLATSAGLQVIRLPGLLLVR